MEEQGDYTSRDGKQLFIANATIQNSIGALHAEYSVDVQNKLEGAVIVSFVPSVPSDTKRAGTIKVPASLLSQFATFPIEIQGVPIEFLIKLAHKVKQDEGKSVYTVNTEKAVEVPKKIIIV
jgi:hypothetical protein